MKQQTAEPQFTPEEWDRHRRNVVQAAWGFRRIARAFDAARYNDSGATYCREQMRARLGRLRTRRTELKDVRGERA